MITIINSLTLHLYLYITTMNNNDSIILIKQISEHVNLKKNNEEAHNICSISPTM